MDHDSTINPMQEQKRTVSLDDVVLAFTAEIQSLQQAVHELSTRLGRIEPLFMRFFEEELDRRLHRKETGWAEEPRISPLEKLRANSGLRPPLEGQWR